VTLAELLFVSPLAKQLRPSNAAPRRCWLSESQPTREGMQSIYGRLVTQPDRFCLKRRFNNRRGLGDQLDAVGIGSNNACLWPFAFDSNRLDASSAQPSSPGVNGGAASCHALGSERSRTEKRAFKSMSFGAENGSSDRKSLFSLGLLAPVSPERRRQTAWYQRMNFR